jgi:hypothetical protein
MVLDGTKELASLIRADEDGGISDLQGCGGLKCDITNNPLLVPLRNEVVLGMFYR